MMEGTGVIIMRRGLANDTVYFFSRRIFEYFPIETFIRLSSTLLCGHIVLSTNLVATSHSPPHYFSIMTPTSEHVQDVSRAFLKKNSKTLS